MTGMHSEQNKTIKHVLF